MTKKLPHSVIKLVFHTYCTGKFQIEQTDRAENFVVYRGLQVVIFASKYFRIIRNINDHHHGQSQILYQNNAPPYYKHSKRYVSIVLNRDRPGVAIRLITTNIHPTLIAMAISRILLINCEQNIRTVCIDDAQNLSVKEFAK